MMNMMFVLVQCLLLLTYLHLSMSLPLSRQSRLSEVEWANYNFHEPQGPGTYAFGYDIEDPETNNIQFRDEERLPNGTVVGSYGFVKSDGNIHIVKYIADENGYRATVEDSLGQPKVFGQPYQSNPYENTPSSILLTALSSQNAYRQQTVHEQRSRPIDRTSTDSPNHNIPTRNNYNDIISKDLPQNWLFGSDSNYEVEPNKYYIRRL